jgi:hypothetical protein
LDRTLDKADEADLRQKIAKGRPAQELVARIDRVSKDARLSAPKIGIPGSTNDPNSPAEYLDNTLEPDAIAAFEQRCYDDDSKLAEVVACHRILTAVVTKPAEYSSGLRARIVRLPGNAGNSLTEERQAVFDDLVESTVTLPKTVEIAGKQVRVDGSHRSIASPPVDIDSQPKRPLPSTGIEIDEKLSKQVPEYLKSGTPNDWSTPLMIGGLLAALFAVAWLSIGSLEEFQNLLGSRPPIAASPSVNEGLAESEGSTKSLAQDQPPLPNLTREDQAESSLPSPVSISEGPLRSELPSPVLKGEGPGVRASEVDSKSETSPQSGVSPMDKDVPLTGVESGVRVSEKANETTPKTDVTVSPKESIAKWRPESDGSKREIVFVTSQPSDPSTLNRLQPDAPIAVSETLLVPPAMRTEFEVGAGIRWTAADTSILQPIGKTESGKPIVELLLGRCLMEAHSTDKVIVIHTPAQELSVEFMSEDTIVAVEMLYRRERGFQFGETAESTSGEVGLFAVPIVRVFDVKGAARITPRETEPVDLELAQTLEWEGVNAARLSSMKEVPWWFREEPQRSIDGQAAEQILEMASTFDPTNSWRDFVKLVSEDRLGEIAAWGLRTRMLVGDFDGLFGTNGFLSNSMARPHRTILLDSLYQAIAASNDGIDQLRKVVVDSDPARSLRLIELVSLPNDEQLEGGVDKRLVEALSSPFTEERSLAVYQLAAIVGKEHGYQPDRPSNESKLTWKRLLDQGKIRWSKK